MNLSNCLNLTTSGLTNKIYEDCCCEIECQLLPATGEECFQISDIQIAPESGTDPDCEILSVNGVLYPSVAFPVTLTASGLTFVLKICSQLSSPRRYDLTIPYLDCAGISQTFAVKFDIETITTVNSWNPAGVASAFLYDFGQINVGQIGSFQATFTNESMCEVDISDAVAGSNCAEITSDFVGSIVPPGGTKTIYYTFTPNAVGVFQCTHTYSGCSGQSSFGGIRFQGEGISPTNCIYCTDVSYYGESPDLIPGESPGCDQTPGSVMNINAFCEKKIFEFDFAYTFGLQSNFQLWFVPELWADVCDFAAKYPSGVIDSAPPVGWYVNYYPGIGTATMTLTGAAAATNSQKNILVEFVEGATVNDFQIRLTFFFGMDLDNWLTSSVLTNMNRLLKSSTYNAGILQNNIPSVYNSDRYACFLFYVFDPNHQVTDPITGQLVDLTCSEVLSYKQTASFLNKSLYDQPSEYLNPTFILERGALQVNEFSTLSKTEITFQIEAPPNYGVDNCIFHVIDVTGNDNLIDFYLNYDSSRKIITTDPSTIVLDNHLEAPSVAPTNIGGQLWEVKAHFGTNANTTQIFRIIAITYSFADTGFLVRSFISDEIPVTDLPNPGELCCPPEIEGTWRDYNNAYLTDCFTPTVKERFCHSLRIQAGEVIDCLIYLGLPPDKVNLWPQFVSSITLNILQEVVDYPQAGQTTSFIFETMTSYYNNAYPNNWQNEKPLTVQEIGSDKNPEIFVEYCGRVRYEEDVTPSIVGVADNATPYTRTSPAGLIPVMIAANNINFDWAQKEIIFEYQIKFDVSYLVGSPFELIHVYRPKMIPFDFEGTEGIFRGLSKIEMFDPSGNQILTPICNDSFDYILIKTTKTDPQDFTLIATIDPVPTGINVLEEEEDYSSPTGLVQMTSLKLYDVDVLFVNDEAFFKIDLTSLIPGTYQICSIALPISEEDIPEFIPDGGGSDDPIEDDPEDDTEEDTEDDTPEEGEGDLDPGEGEEAEDEETDE